MAKEDKIGVIWEKEGGYGPYMSMSLTFTPEYLNELLSECAPNEKNHGNVEVRKSYMIFKNKPFEGKEPVAKRATALGCESQSREGSPPGRCDRGARGGN